MFDEEPSIPAAKFKAATERMRAIIENPNTHPDVRAALEKVVSLSEQRVLIAQIAATQRRRASGI